MTKIPLQPIFEAFLHTDELHDEGKLEALIEILKENPDDDVLDPQVLTRLEPKIRARFKEIDTKRIADQYEADAIAAGFEVSDEPFSFISFSSNNFGRQPSKKDDSSN